MTFDPSGALMTNHGNRILTAFHFYCRSRHKLSTILTANVANLARFVTLTFLFKTLMFFFCLFYLHVLFMIGLPLHEIQ